jgi:hypothetical protein
MDGLRAALAGGFQDAIYAQVTVSGRGRADGICFVGGSYVQSTAVDVRIDSHRLYAQLSAGTQDPYCDLASIRDQYFAEH